MTNRTLPLPPELATFKPFGTGMASVQSGNGDRFHAALGSLGDDKSTFRVWVWAEHPDGDCTLIPIDGPPNNAPSFAVENGALVLYGTLEVAGARTLVARDVPGYVAPAVVDQPARNQAGAATNIAKAALVGVRAVIAWLRGSSTLPNV